MGAGGLQDPPLRGAQGCKDRGGGDWKVLKDHLVHSILGQMEKQSQKELKHALDHKARPQQLFSQQVMADSFVTPWSVAPPGFSVREISKARILEWVAISYPWGSSRFRDQAPIS